MSDSQVMAINILLLSPSLPFVELETLSPVDPPRYNSSNWRPSHQL